MTTSELKPEDHKDFHLKEYESLKKEINDHVEHTRKLELYAVAGLAGFYVWFLRAQHPPHALWIPVALSVLGTFRSWAVQKRIAEIAFYLRRVEFVFAWNRNHLFGWETYRTSPGQKGVPPEEEKMEPWFGPFTTTATIFWVVLFLVSVFALWLLLKAQTGTEGCGI